MNTSVIICGKEYDIGKRVILWNEDKGLNGYDESIIRFQDRNTGKINIIKGKRYGSRSIFCPTTERLKSIISQVFLHHTGNLTPQSTYETLHKERKLSVTFILGDNVLFQTLDVKEKAWHGGENNSCSIGIEICSRASASKYPDDYDEYHQSKYSVAPRKKRYDKIQNEMFYGYEYSDTQYDYLIRLIKLFSKIFPKLTCPDFPRISGRISKSVISNPLKHEGLICHYNTCKGKWDPVCLDHIRILNSIRQGIDVGSTFMKFDSISQRQEALMYLGYYVISSLGNWDEYSILALKEFQKDYGLKQTGVWDGVVEYLIDNEINLR